MKKMGTHYSREIHPAMGLFGLAGLLGSISYYFTHEPFMIAFIGFIGFFGFYFEGKMSNTFKDERYIHNEKKADSASFKFAFGTTIICLLFSFKLSDLELAYTFLVGAISFIWGLSLILSKYLLYKYDSEE